MVVCITLATLATWSPPRFKQPQYLGEIRKRDPKQWKYEPTTAPLPQETVEHIFILSCLIACILLWDEQTIYDNASIFIRL